MAWCFEDEASGWTDQVLETVATEGAMALRIWELEVANVLLVAERRGRITEAQSERFVGLLAQLPIEVDRDAAAQQLVLAAGRRHQLTAYDAAYLVLAERTSRTLATLDQGLVEAALGAGVRVSTPSAQ